jgi:hypothetical protein
MQVGCGQRPAAAVVAACLAWISVPSEVLNIAQAASRIQRSGDRSVPQRVGAESAAAVMAIRRSGLPGAHPQRRVDPRLDTSQTPAILGASLHMCTASEHWRVARPVPP